MYQARDLPSMDKDSFSGRWEGNQRPGAESRELSQQGFSSVGELGLFVGFVEVAHFAGVTGLVVWWPA